MSSEMVPGFDDLLKSKSLRRHQADFLLRTQTIFFYRLFFWNTLLSIPTWFETCEVICLLADLIAAFLFSSALDVHAKHEEVWQSWNIIVTTKSMLLIFAMKDIETNSRSYNAINSLNPDEFIHKEAYWCRSRILVFVYLYNQQEQ